MNRLGWPLFPKILCPWHPFLIRTYDLTSPQDCIFMVFPIFPTIKMCDQLLACAFLCILGNNSKNRVNGLVGIHVKNIQ